jgi:hypothetical protein
LQNLIVRGHHETLEGSAEEILNRVDAPMETMIADIANTHSEPTPQLGEPTPHGQVEASVRFTVRQDG